jgi:hypothetical protein
MIFNATPSGSARSHGFCVVEVWTHPLAAFVRGAWSRSSFKILEDHRRLRLFTRGAEHRQRVFARAMLVALHCHTAKVQQQLRVKFMNLGASRKVMAHRALSSFLGVLVVAGWCMFAYSSRSSAALEQDLRMQIAMGWKDRAQLAAERDQLRTALSVMHNAATQTSSPGDGTKAVPDGSSPAANSSAEDDESLVSQTGSVSSPIAVRASIRTAQMALTQLGYGVVKADGVMGPKTRRAIATFEQANGIAVTGALGAETVHALKQAISKAGTD